MSNQTETAAVITTGNVLNNLVSESSTIVRELIRTAAANDIIAVTLAIILKGVARKYNVITAEDETGINIAIGALVGADVAKDVLSILGSANSAGNHPDTYSPTFIDAGGKSIQEIAQLVQQIPSRSTVVAKPVSAAQSPGVAVTA
jgi:hypothetical protein